MRHVRRGGLLALALALAAGGCTTDPVCTGEGCEGGSSQTDNKAQFESDLPSETQSSGLRGAPGAATGRPASDGAAESAPTAGMAAQADNSAAATRAISEADIIQMQGDTLYALSRVAGLAVIDVSDPSSLKLLGRYRELPAQPFEMYLRDGVALVMFTGWGEYVEDDEGNVGWVSTSKLLALDIANPSDIKKLGSFDVPGSISDSRMVGDILYIVGHEDGYCWRCEANKPRTSIVSLRVDDPRNVTQVDQLFYDDGNSSWGPRSVTVTTERMYVAGPEYGQDMPTGSTIQVVDISDAEGDLKEGTSVQVEGQVNSRWQMDEYEGVLRVVSQPPQWWTEQQGRVTAKPSIETFSVESSDELTELARVDIEIPKDDTLRSVRFDGTRGYAITALQQDPLYTIDLTDPKAPRTVGELKIPGFVYHMEPRGDRVLGLGFDQGNSAGGITVSLFDVSDLATPTELSRVNFGGEWGSLAEDQDRIHKLFRVLDDAGLILVPFSGWSRPENGVVDDCYVSEWVGGVQIIDYAKDSLTKRGMAPSEGQTRRAMLLGDALLSVGDERVESFDIGDRDKPELMSKVLLSQYVSRALQLDGDVVARLSSNYNRYETVVDFVKNSDASEPNESYGMLNLSDEIGVPDSCTGYFNVDKTFVHGSMLELLYQRNSYRVDGKGSVRGLIVVDASDPKSPKVVSNTTWNNDENWNPYYSFFSYGYYGDNAQIVRTEHALAMLESSYEERQDGVTVSVTQKVRLRVADLRDPENVTTSVYPFEAKSAYSGLIASGDTVMTSHFETASADSIKGRFYIDRFDLSDPSDPQQLDKVNVPGALMQYDSASDRAITSEQVRIVVEGEISATECYKRFARADWVTEDRFTNGTKVAVTPTTAPAAMSSGSSSDPEAAAAVEPQPEPEPILGKCTGYKQRLNLVHLVDDAAQLDDTYELDEDQQVYSMSMGDGVMFATINGGGYYGYPGGPAIGISDVACFDFCGGFGNRAPAELLVLGGFDQGALEVGRITVEDSDSARWYGFWGTPNVIAHGKRALLMGQSDIAIIDGSTPSDPKLHKRVPLISYAQHVDIRGDIALLTLGDQGVQWVDLSE